MFYKFFRWFASLLFALALSLSGFTPALAAPPANDNFADAEVITSLPFSVMVDNTEATAEPAEPVGCNFPSNTVWYSFTATENVAVRLSLVFGAVFGRAEVFLSSGPAISDLTFLACASSGSSTNLQLEAGKTYYLRIDGSFGQSGILQMNLEQIFPPANDNFADAEAISSLPFSATPDITNATTEAGEPQGCISPSRSIWYSFTATETMLVRANTSGSGHVSIFLSSGPSISDLTLMTCASNFNPANFNVEAGKTYYLKVDPDFGGAGLLSISLRQMFPPANDNFAGAEVISSLPFSTTIDNTDATTEAGEPSGCSAQSKTVWYSFTPSEEMTVHVDMLGSAGSGSVDIYSSGSGIADLTFITCATVIGPSFFHVEAGKTYYLRVAGDVVGTGTLQINLKPLLPPGNDNFANAEAISSLPFSSTVDITMATMEVDEPMPSCGVGSTDKSAWYSFTPVTSGSVSASIPTAAFAPLFATYTGNLLSGLSEIGCTLYGNMLTFHADAGTTYYFQVTNLYAFDPDASLQFHLDVAPQPVAGFGFSPLDPSIFDNVQFCDTSFDPGAVGVQAVAWDFGDGITSTENCAFHQYAKDGDYTVQQTITTFDGRAASSFQVLHVSTHDVSISKVVAPRTAKVGQTKTITVSLKDARYPETVSVELYRSVPGGWELVGSAIPFVPVLKGSRTTQITFPYSFAPQDAQAGEVTFRAVVTLLNAKDVIPADNEVVSATPTVVKR